MSKIQKKDIAEYYEMSTRNLKYYSDGDIVKQKRYRFLEIGYIAHQLDLSFFDIQKWIEFVYERDLGLTKLLADVDLGDAIEMSVENIRITLKKSARQGKQRMYRAYRIGAICEKYNISHLELELITEKKSIGFFENL